MDEHLLARLPIAQIANLPPKAVQSLAKVGIHCLGDLVRLPPHRLPVALRKDGARLRQLASGFDSDPVRALWPARSAEVTVRFEDGVEDLATIEREIGRLCMGIAKQLSAKSEFCRKIDLSIGLEDGTFLTESVRLALPESRSAPLARAALRALQAAAAGIEQPILSLAITAGDLGAGGGVQLSLPNEQGEMPGERAKRLEAMIETLRRAYGPRVVIPAALLQKARRIDLWVMPFAHRLSEPVSRVATDNLGNPVRFWWKPKGSHARRDNGLERRDVVRRHARWRETSRAKGGGLVDADVWRVETDPAGISEIRHLQAEWRISATFD